MTAHDSFRAGAATTEGRGSTLFRVKCKPATSNMQIAATTNPIDDRNQAAKRNRKNVASWDEKESREWKREEEEEEVTEESSRDEAKRNLSTQLRSMRKQLPLGMEVECFFKVCASTNSISQRPQNDRSLLALCVQCFFYLFLHG